MHSRKAAAMAAPLLLKEDALKNVCLPFVFEKKQKITRFPLQC